MGIFLQVALIIYAVGVGLSQSLMSLGGALFVVIFFVGLFDSVKKRNLSRTESLSVVCGCLFVAVSLIHLLWVNDRSLVGDGIKNIPLFLVPLSAMFPKIRGLFTKKTFTQTLLVAGLSYLVSVSWAFYQVYFLGHVVGVGALNNPIFYAYNLLAALCFFGIIFLNSKLLKISELLKYFALVMMLVVFFGQILSASRTASVTGLVAVSYFLIWAALKAKRKILVLIIVLAVPTTIYTLYKSNTESSRRVMYMAKRGIKGDSSFYIRADLWQHSIEQFKASPFFGVGYKQNRYNAADAPKKIGSWAPGTNIFAHNIYIQSLAEAGVVGTLLHATSYIAAAVAAPAALPILGFTAIAGISENTFHNSKALHSFLFFFLLGLLPRSPSRQPT